MMIKLPKKSVAKLLDQPIPPMMKANSYCELDTPDFNIRIKGFSPIRINKYGDRNRSKCFNKIFSSINRKMMI